MTTRRLMLAVAAVALGLAGVVYATRDRTPPWLRGRVLCVACREGAYTHCEAAGFLYVQHPDGRVERPHCLKEPMVFIGGRIISLPASPGPSPPSAP